MKEVKNGRTKGRTEGKKVKKSEKKKKGEKKVPTRELFRGGAPTFHAPHPHDPFVITAHNALPIGRGANRPRPALGICVDDSLELARS